ncbi:hypothetical protein HON03_02270, partial [archaeon]|nr:hypothetical protein [archaeon]MBT7052740.1 hypothetical protein [archaeon]
TCADGLDNDADGSIDLLDSDCDSWYSYEGEETESVEEIVCTDEIPTCADGLDNDADGSIDLLDSDCDSWYSYEVETGVQETDSQVECNKNGDCDSGVCISNSCITCEDNDGQDYEVQGSSSGYVSSLEEERSVVDVCGFGDALNEYYCNKIGYLVYDSVDCVAEGYSTCENGICIIIEGSISEDAQELMAETEVVIPVSDSTETVVSSTVDECTNGEWVVEEECFEDTDCGRARYSCENNFCVGSDLTCDEYNDENGCSDSGYCNWETVQVGTTTSSYCDGSDKDEDSINAYFDCNERDATINPQASEDCADGLDNNCDGLIDCADSSCSSDSACSSYSCDIAICNNDLDCADQGDNNYCNLDGCCVDICEDENLALGVEVLSSICYSNDDCGTLQECNIVSGECETVAVQIGRNVDVEKFRAAETDEGIFSRFFSWVGGLFS